MATAESMNDLIRCIVEVITGPFKYKAASNSSAFRGDAPKKYAAREHYEVVDAMAYRSEEEIKVLFRSTKRMILAEFICGEIFWGTKWKNAVNLNVRVSDWKKLSKIEFYFRQEDDMISGSKIKGWLSTILVVATAFACLMLLLPYDPVDEIKVPKVIFNTSPPIVFQAWVISNMFAFCGSLIGLKLVTTKRQIASLCLYFALLAMMFSILFLILSIIMGALISIS